MRMFDLKVVVVSQCQLFSLPIIKEAVMCSQGEVVGVESELNAVSLNRSIKRNKANLLILTINDKNSIYPLVSAVKRVHPSVKIIMIALKLKQIPIIIKTRMIRAIIVANESIDQLIEAIERIAVDQSYYSPKTSEVMAEEIARPDLTAREKEVQDLLDENKSRNEIANQLRISYATVSTHVRNINTKIGA